MTNYDTIIENIRKEFSMQPKKPTWEEPQYSGKRYTVPEEL